MNHINIDQIDRIHIAGAGIMGASMAQIFARHGYAVVLYDAFEQGIANGKNLVAVNQEAAVNGGELTQTESDELQGRIRYTMDKTVFGDAQLVIEAIIERMDIKHEFWREISRLTPENAILTTNTSGLSITEMAQAVESPERFAGFHWVNPPHIVPLVEVISGEQTADTVIEVIMALSERVGKKPVRVKRDAPGFILNRLQFCVLREAMHIVESGIAGREDVDKVLKYGLGLRYACLGPFEIADFGGLDTFHAIAGYLFPDLCAAKEPQAMLRELYNEGSYGVKSGKGFYEYPGDRANEVTRQRDAAYSKIAKGMSRS